MITNSKTALTTIASHLRAVHKLLLEHEKRIYEKTYGRIENPYQLLHLTMQDPQFAWLRAMSGEMVNLDEVRLRREGVSATDLRLIGTRIRALMVADRKPTSFQQHYYEARDVDPGIMLAHRDLMKALPPKPAVDLFLSAGNEQDNKDPLPGSIRPGTLIPGFGDRGYYALGAIEERGLLDGVPLKSVRYANETVLGLASVPVEWTTNHESVVVDPWTPLVVQAGTGAIVARTSVADGVLVSLYVRQQATGGDSTMLLPEGKEEDEWLLVADAESLANEITAFARLIAANSEVLVPVRPGSDLLIYVVAGAIEIDGVEILDSRLALIRNPASVVLETKSDAMLLAVVVNPDATITRAGSVAR